MPNYTANFALPYPNGDDDPCDFAAQWCNFADAVNAALDVFQETIDRTVPTVPAAQFKLTNSVTYPSNGLEENIVGFDTVTFDTAGWIDFDADNRQIFTDRAMNSITISAMAALSDQLNGLWFLITNGGITNMNLDRNIANSVVAMPGVENNTLVSPLTTYISVNAPSTAYTLQSAYLGVFWHADTQRGS